jgi:hypothetical protein
MTGENPAYGATSPEKRAAEVRKVAWGLIDAAIPPACLEGVAANLTVLARHAGVVRRAVAGQETIDAAEVFRA